MNKKYDLIFGIGEACSCSQALRNQNLQVYSYPFDWLFGSTFEGRINILVNKFKDFINKSDLEYSYSKRNIHCNAYHNKKNDLTFNHDFQKDISFEEAYPQIRTKYDRRINRLLQKIESAKSILVVYIQTPELNHIQIENDLIISSFAKIKKCYPDKIIHCLFLQNKQNSPLEKENLNDDITKIIYDYKNYSSSVSYEPDWKKLNDIFKQYKLALPFYYYPKRKIQKFIINLIPIKEQRKKLRKKYHV